MQFSLKLILMVMAAAAVACGLLFALPDRLALCGMALPFVVLPGWLVTALIYGRGATRAFAIGAMPVAIIFGVISSWLLVWSVINALENDPVDAEFAVAAKILFALSVGVVVLAGTSAMMLRWLLAPTRRTPRASSPPPVLEQNGPVFSGRFSAPSDAAVLTGEVLSK